MWKETMMMRMWARKNVPMIAYTRPRVVATDDERVVICIPLRRRTKNHLGSMYFGALAVGADMAAGFLALMRIRQSGRRVSFVFKSNEAAFLRRPDGDVHFTCVEGKAITALVDKALKTGERHDLDIPVICTVPSVSGDKPVARFIMTLSVKAKEEG